MEVSMHKSLLAATAVGLLLLGGPGVVAQDKSPRKPDVSVASKLVQQLGDTEFSVREAAEKQLARDGH